MELPILEQGTVVGVCRWAQEGLHIRFLCRLPGRHTLCKLWLERQGTKTLLGTPAPEEGGLLLRRTLSQRELEHSGSFPPEHILCTGEETTAGHRAQGVPGGDAFFALLIRAGRLVLEANGDGDGVVPSMAGSRSVSCAGLVLLLPCDPGTVGTMHYTAAGCGWYAGFVGLNGKFVDTI